MLRSILALIGLTTFVAVAQVPSKCNSEAPLNQVVQGFHSRNLRLLDALIQFGLENHICLGIEAMDEDLLNLRTDFDANNVTANEVLRRIVEPSVYLDVVDQDGVVLIRPRPSLPGFGWLDFVVPKFTAPQNRLQWTNDTLFMTFMTSADPSIQTFVGTFPVGDMSDVVGPFREEGKTVRQLLNLLVTNSSKGAMWVAYGPAVTQRDRPKGIFWRVLQYSEGHDAISRTVSSLVPTPRPQR